MIRPIIRSAQAIPLLAAPVVGPSHGPRNAFGGPGTPVPIDAGRTFALEATPGICSFATATIVVQ